MNEESEEVKIIDESGDRRYFTIIPNYIINHSSAVDQALYLQMKRHAGENGVCFATQETLMKKLGVGRKTLLKSLEYLTKRKWIKFIGLTEGKTRPIKTYKVNDIWKINNDFFSKIPSERTVSPKNKKDTVQLTGKIPSERTVEEEPYKEDPIGSNASVAAINRTLEKFKGINPSYKQLYGNKTERAATGRMLSEHGEEKLGRLVESLPEIVSRPFAPMIVKPTQLERKFGELIVFMKQESNKQKNLTEKNKIFDLTKK